MYTTMKGTSRMARTRNTIVNGYDEAKGMTITGLKLATIVLPIAAALSLGLPSLTNQEIMAIASLVLGMGIGVYWLNRN